MKNSKTNTFLFLLLTSKLGKGPQLLGGSRRSVMQLVQQDLFVCIKEVRAEARYGRSGATNIVPAITIIVHVLVRVHCLTGRRDI